MLHVYFEVQATQLNIKFLVSVLEEFQVKNPIIWSSQFRSGISWMKMLLQLDQYCKMKSSLTEVNHGPISSDVILIFHELKEVESYFQQNKRINSTHIVILQDIDFNSITNSMAIPIDARVFFVNLSSNEVFEFYKINSFSVKTRLGRLNEESGQFKWNHKVNADFFIRRFDFYGTTLKGMTEETGKQLILDPRYCEKAPYFPNNQTYLVTDFTMGLYYDVLLEVQKMLNFTTKLYKRKEISWGFVYPQGNGTFEAEGIVGDIFFGRADLIVAPVTLYLRRALYIDYLPPLTQKNIGLYISSVKSKEALNFYAFIKPFRYSSIVYLPTRFQNDINPCF